MISCDKAALLCDMAETYRIYDIYSFPARLIAIYAAGLRDNSRIKLKLSGVELDYTQIIQTAVYDKLNLLLWQNSGGRKSNRPISLLDKILRSFKRDDYTTFDTAEAFEAERKKIMKGGKS